MKIAIAKSLLEPAGIPWFLITSKIDLARHIKFILLGNFHDMKRTSILPCVDKNDYYHRLTTKNVCTLLAQLANNHGADRVAVTSYGLFEDDVKVGYSFRIEFTIPGDTKRYRQWLDTCTG